MAAEGGLSTHIIFVSGLKSSTPPVWYGKQAVHSDL